MPDAININNTIKIPVGPATLEVGLKSFDAPSLADPDTYFAARERYHTTRLLQNGFPFGMAGIAWNQMMLAATRAQYAAAKAMLPRVFDGKSGSVQVVLPVVSWSSSS